jgi:hypothetical protein
VDTENVKHSVVDLVRGAALLGKGAVNGALQLPGIVTDAVTGGYNMLTGSHQPTTQQALETLETRAGVPVAKNNGEAFLQQVGGMYGANKVPLPTGEQLGVPQPTGMPQPTALQQSAQAAANGNYKVNPALTTDSPVQRLLAWLGGPKALSQTASKDNLEQLTKNMANNFGLPKGTEITEQSLASARANAAAKGYDPIRAMGSGYSDLLDTIMKTRNLAQRLYKQNAATYNVDTENLANQTWANAQRYEQILDKALAQSGAKPDVIAGYQAARKTIAQTYDVEKGLVESKATLNAKPFANAFENNPSRMTGTLQDTGRAASAFPSAFKNQSPYGQLPGIVQGMGLDAAIAGSGIGLHFLSGHPEAAATVVGVAGLRAALRKGLLSDTVRSYNLLNPTQKAEVKFEAMLRAGASQIAGSTTGPPQQQSAPAAPPTAQGQ